MTRKRMKWLKIYTQFPPMRKWMEVLPVWSWLPSCLRPLSRGEGIQLIWTLDNILLVLRPLGSSTYILLLCVWEATRNNLPSFHKRPNIWPQLLLLFCFRATFLWVQFLRYLLSSVFCQCFFPGLFSLLDKISCSTNFSYFFYLLVLPECSVEQNEVWGRTKIDRKSDYGNVALVSGVTDWFMVLLCPTLLCHSFLSLRMKQPYYMAQFICVCVCEWAQGRMS